MTIYWLLVNVEKVFISIYFCNYLLFFHVMDCITEDDFFAYSSDMNGIFLLEETVPLCVFPSVLIISRFITLKKICCNFKKRRCILGENMPLFWWRQGVVLAPCRFLRIMRCIFLRAHAPARAINIIVQVFLLLLCITKKYAA